VPVTIATLDAQGRFTNVDAPNAVSRRPGGIVQKSAALGNNEKVVASF
jgi:hypothetical protein